MARGRLGAAKTLTAIAVAGTAACTLLVPVDDLTGPAAAGFDAAEPRDAAIADTGVDRGSLPDDDAAPLDGAPSEASTDAAPTSWTLLGNSSPVSPMDPQTTAIEVGVRFTASAPGDVVAIRFFRTVGNPSGYVVHLWSGDGTLLATAEAPPDDGQPIGWREQAIAATHVTPSSVYVASYFSSGGTYSYTKNGFATALTSGPLTALASGDSGTDGNGVFDYSMVPLTAPPASTFEETNYFVDVRFSPTP